ncbi:MAG: 2-methylaconitate cis-trans isomerase PrpF [Proteobacteria bacterium]|nr:2-methylaconitate cis-trans isomerase PrpF [Pseudomonadota bacterium]NOG59431.1 2-methylaconitate cis-trans isomerase PrpF [Pseudomonadota bacterium]
MKSIPVSLMRGGTSKGVFMLRSDLPDDTTERDKILLQLIGSPDPYSKQINGLGGATSSTSKVVVVDKSNRQNIDVDYLFGHVAIKEPVIDYSGNCGNLTSAVGVFAIEQGLIENVTSPITEVRVWQENLGQTIIVNVPVDEQKQVITKGDTKLAGVTGKGAPIVIDFIKPGNGDESLVLPTGKVKELLEVDYYGSFEVSLVQAGNATVFVREFDLGLSGKEIYDEINNNDELLKKVEAIRCSASVKMGLTKTIEEAKQRPGTPKLAFVNKPRNYINSQGEKIKANEMDVYARIFSMGKLHHAFTGTGAIAIAVAANIPNTIVADCLLKTQKQSQPLRIGHTAGTLECSAVVSINNENWITEKASLVRTARTLLRGDACIN